MKTGRSSASGLLLIVMTGLLTLLSVIGVLMVYLARTERHSSLYKVDGVRARLITRSGVESAVARLRLNPEPDPIDPAQDWTYRDATSTSLYTSYNPSYHAGEPWVDVSPNGRYDDGLDVFVEDKNGNGAYDGWSGRLRGTYQGFGDTFKLRIEGGQGKIHLNGGYLDGQDRDEDGIFDHRDTWVSRRVNGFNPAEVWLGGGLAKDALDVGTGWNGQLTRTLDNLVEGLVPAIGLARDARTNPVAERKRHRDQPYFPDPPRSEPTLGTWLVSNRPLGGYRSWAQVEQVMLDALASGAAWMQALSPLVASGSSWSEFLKPYVTLHAWTDRVIHPDDPFSNTRPSFVHYATTGPTGEAYALAYGGEPHEVPLGGPGYLRHWWVTSPPQLEERAPIAVNMANRPVLIAAMTDLGRLGPRRVEERIPPSIAQRVADRILRRRVLDPDSGSFESWREWGSFCESLVNSPVGPYDPETEPLAWFPYEAAGPDYDKLGRQDHLPPHRAEILKHHFNPNGHILSDLEDVNRNVARYYGDIHYRNGWLSGGDSIDFASGYALKGDIFPYSTEWTFHPSAGFHIESVGEVEQGAVTRAVFSAYVEIRLLGVYRASSQADFVGGRATETYVSANTDPFLDTHGAAMGRHGGKGVAVVTYPEPEGVLPTHAAYYDGYVGLATVEDRPIAALEGETPIGHTFLHHFDDGWDADVAAGDPHLIQTPDNTDLETKVVPLWNDPLPGSIYPDGGSTEPTNQFESSPPPYATYETYPPWHMIPAFRVDGNIPSHGKHGLVMYWTKMARHPIDHKFLPVEFRMTRKQEKGYQTLALGSTTRQLETKPFWFFIERRGGEAADSTQIVPAGLSPGFEQGVPLPPADPGPFIPVGQWFLQAGFWNIKEGRTGKDPYLWVGGPITFAEAPKRETGIIDLLTPQHELLWRNFYYGHVDEEERITSELTDWAGGLFTMGSSENDPPAQFPVAGGHIASEAELLDEYAVYDLGSGWDGTRGQRDELFDRAQNIVNTRWQEGRYYKKNDATFTSPQIDLLGAKIRRIYFTVIPPAPELQEDLADAKVSVRITGGALTEEMFDERGFPMELPTEGPIQYKVRFYPTMEGEELEWSESKRLNTPVIQSPWFDDITIVYELPEGAPFLIYEERLPDERIPGRAGEGEPAPPVELPETPDVDPPVDPGPAPDPGVTPPGAPGGPPAPEPPDDVGVSPPPPPDPNDLRR